MQADYLAAIDWSAPWLTPYRNLGQTLVGTVNWREDLNRLAKHLRIRNFQGIPLQFIAQESLPEGVPYEAHIGLTGEVPTRENLHDFFNGLVWLHFPRTKARLNQLQFDQLRHEQGGEDADGTSFRVGNARGKLRDAATIFDENGALLLCSRSDIANKLREHDWSVLSTGRAEFSAFCRLVLFGHALMEKLVQPYPAITTHWLLASIDQPQTASPEQMDALVPTLLEAGLETQAFSPLPVLGVPGWWPDQGTEFYANTDVFRPKRRRRV